MALKLLSPKFLNITSIRTSYSSWSHHRIQFLENQTFWSLGVKKKWVGIMQKIRDEYAIRDSTLEH